MFLLSDRLERMPSGFSFKALVKIMSLILDLTLVRVGQETRRCPRSPTISGQDVNWQCPNLLLVQCLCRYSVRKQPDIILARTALLWHSKLLLPAVVHSGCGCCKLQFIGINKFSDGRLDASCLSVSSQYLITAVLTIFLKAAEGRGVLIHNRSVRAQSVFHLA